MVVITEVATGGFVGFLVGEVIGIAFLGENRGDLAAVGVEPVFGGDMLAVHFERGGDGKDGVGFFISNAADGTDEVGKQLGVKLLGEGEGFVMEGAAGGEGGIVIGSEVADVFDTEGQGEDDGDGADGEDFDLAVDADGAVGAEAFKGREPDHSGAVEEELARGTFVGVDLELSDGGAEQGCGEVAADFVGDIEGVEVADGAAVTGGRGDGGMRMGGSGCHTQYCIGQIGWEANRIFA